MDSRRATHRLPLGMTLAVAVLLGAAACLPFGRADPPLVIANPSPATAFTGPKAFISGEVARPGVYAFQVGDRVEQLVALAGGFTEDADVDAVNLALRLKDEQQVHVPRRAELGIVGATSQPKLIDLNSASAAELESLPGIGPATAQKIIEHRTKVGPYARVDDLLTLKLVNSSTFEKVRSLVIVR